MTENITKLETFHPGIPLQRQEGNVSQDGITAAFNWYAGGSQSLLVNFFIAPFPCEVLSVHIYHTNNASGTATYQIRKIPLLTFQYTAATSDVLTSLDPALTPPANNTQIFFTTQGVIPTGLSTNVTYYVRDLSGSTFKVSASSTLGVPGTAVDITGTGSGTNRGHYYGTAENLLSSGDELDDGLGSVHIYRRNTARGLVSESTTLNEGDRLDSYLTAGSDPPTGLTDLCVTVYLKSIARGDYRLK